MASSQLIRSAFSSSQFRSCTSHPRNTNGQHLYLCLVLMSNYGATVYVLSSRIRCLICTFQNRGRVMKPWAQWHTVASRQQHNKTIYIIPGRTQFKQTKQFLNNMDSYPLTWCRNGTVVASGLFIIKPMVLRQRPDTTAKTGPRSPSFSTYRRPSSPTAGRPHFTGKLSQCHSSRECQLLQHAALSYSDLPTYSDTPRPS